jgi:hypothetical protein
MKLWTIHDTYDFKLSKGHVDHSKSDYYNNTPGVKEAYYKLWPLIQVPDGQIIWCYTRKEDIRKTGTPKIKYTLKVPEDSVITYIDDIMWNYILGIRVNLTQSYKRKIRAEAGNKFPNNPCKRKTFEKELENKFWENKPPARELWEKLRLDKAVDGSPALIKHPIPYDWIIKSETIQYS